MPDLSILVQLAEYYDVEMRELLDGERSQTMNKEMKETLDKVAVYEEWVKQKALKAGNLAFASMFVISVLAIIIQMLLTVDIRLVLGETATALVGGTLYASIMVYNGIWDKCLPKSATIWRDFLTSVICAGIFTVIYGICLFKMGATETQVTRLALGFLIGITIVAFIVLRLLAFINRKRNQNSSNVQEKKETSLSKAEWTKIYNAQNIVETEQLVEMLKQNGIVAFSQESGANVAMHGGPKGLFTEILQNIISQTSCCFTISFHDLKPSYIPLTNKKFILFIHIGKIFVIQKHSVDHNILCGKQ